MQKFRDVLSRWERKLSAMEVTRRVKDGRKPGDGQRSGSLGPTSPWAMEDWLSVGIDLFILCSLLVCSPELICSDGR
jgi:hypothetical protein